jgi:nucleoside-diphosphate-sugar epimerase
MRKRVLVTGAGGLIGHHLMKYLVGEGHWVRGIWDVGDRDSAAGDRW